MKSSNPISEKADARTSDELYEMANLFPRTTGLPMTVWVGPRGNARHDVRIKVNLTHGNQMNIDNTAVCRRSTCTTFGGRATFFR
jgi:hypothetical protein